MELHLIKDAEHIKIKLSKGQKDSYGWEITVKGNDYKSMLAEQEKIDGELRAKYGSNNTATG